LFEVSQGLEYLHCHNIVHGDLRGGNVLIDDASHARFADFGLSRFSEATKGAYTTATREGSTRWTAPELFPDSDEDEGEGPCIRRTRQTDVYVYGCLCLEVRFVHVSLACSRLT
ncbi:kinase-like protein, partial [Gloeophyllum trabeum ATCC 11539]